METEIIDSEYPELEVGEVFTTDQNERFRCVGHHEDGCPICEPVD